MQELLNLNLAINQIQTVENLKGCESLEKLDLTLNQVTGFNFTLCMNWLDSCLSSQVILLHRPHSSVK